MFSLNPYLVFNGNCKESFTLYAAVFRSKELYLGRYADAPPEAKTFFANAPDDYIMHATLKIDERTVIMGNDKPEPSGESTQLTSTDFYLYIDTIDPNEAVRIFNELSVGGVVIVPIAQTFWSPLYGVLADKFGINWKITSHQGIQG